MIRYPEYSRIADLPGSALAWTENAREKVYMSNTDQQRMARFGFNTYGNVIPVPAPKGRNVTIIAAMDARNGIGKANGIPWAISSDLQQFQRLTLGHPVIMGRKTFDSLPINSKTQSRALRYRTNIVLTRDIDVVGRILNEVTPANGLPTAIITTTDRQIFIIGGAAIYQQALELDMVDDMILTRLNHDAQCDTFFPEFDKSQWLEPTYSSQNLGTGIILRYEYWRRIKKE